MKPSLRPIHLGLRRRIRTHAEWNVQTHMPSAVPTRWAMRSRISAAALLVNVIARIWLGHASRALDEPGDAPGEHARLAGPGPGDDEQGRTAVEHRLALLRC